MSTQNKLYVLPGSPRASSCILALNLAKVDYELVYQTLADLKDESYLKLNPFGKSPCLDTPEGPIFESGAIARWAARRSSGLYGSNDVEATKVDMWYDWARTTLYPKAASFIYSIFGLEADFVTKHDEKSFREAIADFVKFCKPLDAYLKGKDYLVGNGVTIADVALVTDLNSIYKFCLEKKDREALPNVTAYFTKLVNSKDFAAVLRGYKPSDQTFKIKYYSKKEKNAKNVEKKEKKQEKKPEKKAAPVVEEKKKEPEFPATNFDMHSFKTFFVNEPDVQKKMDYLWQNFDEKAMSIWHLTYDKLPSECKKLFLTNNLMTGFIDRAAHMRKHVFGVHDVVGEEGNYNIKGVWMGRGTEELPLIKEHDQCDVYKYRKLDPKNPEDKKLITEYFTKKEEDKDTVEGEVLRTFSYVL